MFIDIHTHIIPEVDDGSDSITTTLEMLKIAQAEGIKEMIATPHFIPHFNKYDKALLQDKYQLVKDLIEEECIDIKLHLGNELFLDENLVRMLKNKDCFTLARSKHILLELPMTWREEVIDNIIYNIQLAGYTIVLAHVERYDKLRDEKTLLKYIKKGCLTQVNSHSLFRGDKSNRQILYSLIENNYIHIISTDCHNMKTRKPRITKAYSKVTSLIGSKADELFTHNPKKIIDNMSIEIDEPLPLKRRKWWGGINKWISTK